MRPEPEAQPRSGTVGNLTHNADESPLADAHFGPCILATAVLKYAEHLRNCYPLDEVNDPLTQGMHQIAAVLERRALSTPQLALRLWLSQYAQALFWAHTCRTDPYSVGVCGVAGDLEVALLAWGDPEEPPSTFQAIVADTFGVTSPRPTPPRATTNPQDNGQDQIRSIHSG